jgi:hypothetical protein
VQTAPRSVLLRIPSSQNRRIGLIAGQDADLAQ